MSKSNIALAILAGAVIGGIVAIVLKAENALEDNGDETEDDDGEEKETPMFENIARQFAARISSELKAAENKIKNAGKKDSDFIIPEDEFGVFL